MRACRDTSCTCGMTENAPLCLSRYRSQSNDDKRKLTVNNDGNHSMRWDEEQMPTDSRYHDTVTLTQNDRQRTGTPSANDTLLRAGAPRSTHSGNYTAAMTSKRTITILYTAPTLAMSRCTNVLTQSDQYDTRTSANTTNANRCKTCFRTECFAQCQPVRSEPDGSRSSVIHTPATIVSAYTHTTLLSGLKTQHLSCHRTRNTRAIPSQKTTT
jgi:hypothetical protein